MEIKLTKDENKEFYNMLLSRYHKDSYIFISL